MGAGASAESARTTVTTMLSGKPADASDITVRQHGQQWHFASDGLMQLFSLFVRTLNKPELKFATCEESPETSRIS